MIKVMKGMGLTVNEQRRGFIAKSPCVNDPKERKKCFAIGLYRITAIGIRNTTLQHAMRSSGPLPVSDRASRHAGHDLTDTSDLTGIVNGL